MRAGVDYLWLSAKQCPQRYSPVQVWSLSNYMANVWTYMRYPGDFGSPHASPRQALSPPRLPSPRVRPGSRDGKPDAALGSSPAAS